MGSPGSLGVVVLLVIAGGVLFAIASAVKHKRWGLAFAIPLLASMGMVLILTPFSYRKLSQDFEGMPALVKLPPPSAPGAPKVPPVAVVTDADLLTVAAALPSIELNDQPTDATATSEPDAEVEEFIDLDEVAIEEPSDRPAWLDGELESHQRVFTLGPFTTPGVVRGTPPNYSSWVWDQASVRQPDLGPTPPEWWGEALEEVEQRTTVATYVEVRETSVGTVYIHHWLAEVDDHDREWLAERSDAWLAKSRRERGVQRVALGGGALLAGVAVLYGYLRSGGRRHAIHDT